LNFDLKSNDLNEIKYEMMGATTNLCSSPNLFGLLNHKSFKSMKIAFKSFSKKEKEKKLISKQTKTN